MKFQVSNVKKEKNTKFGGLGGGGGGGLGSFLHGALRWKFQSQGYQRFLQNEDILPYEKNIAI